MIYFDVTKSGRARHASGLMRVNRRLLEELGATATPVVWGKWDGRVTAADWFFTTETFDSQSRPGFMEFVESRRCRTAAVFPDAIPLQHPQITWPHSVARHPRFMTELARFDQVFAISAETKRRLEKFWRWQDSVAPRAEVGVLPLGADFDRAPRCASVATPVTPPKLVCVGIVEPRKNQAFLARVCEQLWAEKAVFELHIVGRPNPHFGAPIVDELNRVSTRFPALRYHPSLDDAGLARLLDGARAVIFPTIAEGCGLPILESLWRGLPCICSDLPVLRENTDAGGCLALPTNDGQAWANGIRKVISNSALWARLADEAASRELPTWRDSAETVRAQFAV